MIVCIKPLYWLLESLLPELLASHRLPHKWKNRFCKNFSHIFWFSHSISVTSYLRLQFGGTVLTSHSPKTITNVILMVFTLAFGIRPRELARLQSGSFSRAIFLLRASVKGTENESHINQARTSKNQRWIGPQQDNGWQSLGEEKNCPIKNGNFPPQHMHMALAWPQPGNNFSNSHLLVEVPGWPWEAPSPSPSSRW